jgi:glycosyltransferase involved in cell wall biosynthesis
MSEVPEIVGVMPAYNAAKTLCLAYSDLRDGLIDQVILVDDGSSDETVKIARELGLEVFVHNRNYGYGANQKTCYREALKLGADIVVMVHPDYQYDPKLLPSVIEPLKRGEADIVLGSRLLAGDAVQHGMPSWKFFGNRFLTGLENLVFGLNLSEYHTGYRAYRKEALETVNMEMNSDNFLFDQEIIAQFIESGLRIAEVPVPARYFPEASSASFVQSSVYGLSILQLLIRYMAHRAGLRQRQFLSLQQRYQRVSAVNNEP